MTRDDAIDTLMVIMGPESYDLLVRQTGYSVDRFRAVDRPDAGRRSARAGFRLTDSPCGAAALSPLTERSPTVP